MKITIEATVVEVGTDRTTSGHRITLHAAPYHFNLPVSEAEAREFAARLYEPVRVAVDTDAPPPTAPAAAPQSTARPTREEILAHVAAHPLPALPPEIRGVLVPRGGAWLVTYEYPDGRRSGVVLEVYEYCEERHSLTQPPELMVCELTGDRDVLSLCDYGPPNHARETGWFPLDRDFNRVPRTAAG